MTLEAGINTAVEEDLETGFSAELSIEDRMKELEGRLAGTEKRLMVTEQNLMQLVTVIQALSIKLVPILKHFDDDTQEGPLKVRFEFSEEARDPDTSFKILWHPDEHPTEPGEVKIFFPQDSGEWIELPPAEENIASMKKLMEENQLQRGKIYYVTTYPVMPEAEAENGELNDVAEGTPGE